MLLRDASRTPKVLGIDAKAFALTFPTLFLINWWTLTFDVLIFVLFIYLRIKKIEISFAYRRFRAWARGSIVESRPWWFLKKWRNR